MLFGLIIKRINISYFICTYTKVTKLKFSNDGKSFFLDIKTEQTFKHGKNNRDLVPPSAMSLSIILFGNKELGFGKNAHGIVGPKHSISVSKVNVLLYNRVGIYCQGTLLYSFCVALFYRKRLPQQNGDRRKRNLHAFDCM
jgi:hypothetical protein